MKQKKLAFLMISIAILGIALYLFWAYNANFFMKIKEPEAYEAVADID